MGSDMERQGDDSSMIDGPYTAIRRRVE